MADVLVLQHVPSEGPGLIADALGDAGLGTRVVRVFNGEPVLCEPGDAAGLVVMGGPMGVYEAARYGHLRDEMALIEAAVQAGVPVLGVCLGSQLLAAALGAAVRPAPAKEIGWHEVRLTPEAAADPLFSGVPGAFVPLHWHGDVFDLPAGAVPLASSAATAHQAFRHGEAWGLLFHAEVTPGAVGAMASAFADELAEEGVGGAALRAEAVRRFPALRSVARTVFGRWARRVAARARPAGYVPVACGFYDTLEGLALRGRAVALVVRADDGTEAALEDTVADVYARGGAEYVRLGSGREVRLDRLARVAGVEPGDVC